MSGRLEFFYDYACPYAYLGHTQVEALAARTGAELVWRPMLLGGVFRAVGTPQVPMTAMSAAKARLNALDMMRWADHFGVPLVMPPMHPNRTVLALRATLAAEENVPRASKALFRAYWVLGRDVSQPDVVRDALDEAGLDGARLVERADEPAIKEALRSRTDEAVAHGVFGAPAFRITARGRTELIWGQDRLGLVERALTGNMPDAPAPRTSEAGVEVEFFFDFSSPFAYLAATQIEALAKRHEARVVYRPFLLGALFKSIGTPNVPLFDMPEAKRNHSIADMNRWADAYGVPLRFPSRFPMNTVKPLRMVLQVPDDAKPRLVNALFRAYWADDRDLANDDTLVAIASDAGLDGAALLRGASSDAVKERLRSATEEAERLGLCGAPSFLVKNQLFWGQDRMIFVEKILNGWRPPS